MRASELRTWGIPQLLNRVLGYGRATCIGLLALLVLAGCNPVAPGRAGAKPAVAASGEYLYAANGLFEADAPFDIRWRVKYPTAADYFDPTTNTPNRELALERCTRCHECGFAAAFDKANFGTPAWKPRIVGDDWSTPVNRMQRLENSFLNEAIATRIYTYLRDETTGVYKPEEDQRGAIVVELDPEPLSGMSGANGS